MFVKAGKLVYYVCIAFRGCHEGRQNENEINVIYKILFILLYSFYATFFLLSAKQKIKRDNYLIKKTINLCRFYILFVAWTSEHKFYKGVNKQNVLEQQETKAYNTILEPSTPRSIMEENISCRPDEGIL